MVHIKNNNNNNNKNSDRDGKEISQNTIYVISEGWNSRCVYFCLLEFLCTL